MCKCCISHTRCNLSRSHTKILRVSTSCNKTHYQQIAESLVFYPASRTPASLIIARFIQIKLERVAIAWSYTYFLFSEIILIELIELTEPNHGQKNMPCTPIYTLCSHVISINSSRLKITENRREKQKKWEMERERIRSRDLNRVFLCWNVGCYLTK